MSDKEATNTTPALEPFSKATIQAIETLVATADYNGHDTCPIVLSIAQWQAILSWLNAPSPAAPEAARVATKWPEQKTRIRKALNMAANHAGLIMTMLNNLGPDTDTHRKLRDDLQEIYDTNDMLDSASPAPAGGGVVSGRSR